MTKTVAEIMTAEPVVVKKNTPLSEAIQILVDRKVSGLPVVDDHMKLVGIISEGDLTWQETGVDTPPYIMLLDSVIYLQNPAKHDKEIHKALGQTVGEVMSDKVVTITPDKMVRDAAHLMHEKHVGRLPVLESGSRKVLGIITQGDIIRAMAQAS
ncbi:CBS domain-containing protein [[Limnothrix rosea] IAM M-220]|uniref:CBS domain-containing protein n=1 Tax=[Limnothrix rosea] IAM M-220 TaxID=454133 RepID=UPI00095A81D6|nr:CBS domain-containing protein [[Limnothrix rosea] IAM M-220]OKH20058.1 phosphoribulokinase [[Limnothrix rosea] IAM M-220]